MTRSRLIVAIRLVVLLALALWYSAEVFFLFPVALVMPPLFVTTPDCPIHSDTFATDRLAAEYTSVSGTWSVASNQLQTSSDGAVLLINAVSNGHGRVSVDVTDISTAGGAATLLGSYTDSSNYIYIKVDWDGTIGTAKLHSVIGGSDTEEGVVFICNLSEVMTISLCWDGTHAEAFVDTSACSSFEMKVRRPYTGEGTKAGLAATANGGTVKFDNLVFTSHADDNPICTLCPAQPCDGIELSDYAYTSPLIATVREVSGGCIPATETITTENSITCGTGGTYTYPYFWSFDSSSGCGSNTGSQITFLGQAFHCTGTMYVTTNLVSGYISILSRSPLHALGNLSTSSGFNPCGFGVHTIEIEITE